MVFACEPQPIVLEGLTRVLASCDDIEFLGAAPTLREALEVLQGQRPDVLLVDQSAGLKVVLQFIADVRGTWPQCQPVLLEPIYQVEIVCPSEATAKMNALMSGRRGQILGFDTREGWEGWDVVRVQMPESEIGDLIVEVRSATAGVGSFSFKFDHMAELTGRTADQIVAARKSAAAA